MSTPLRNALRRLPGLAALAAAVFARGQAPAQVPPREVNYDESKVPGYALPDPLLGLDGKKVVERWAWRPRQRDVLNLFAEHVYGHAPGQPPSMTFRLLDEDRTALGGKATRKVVSVDFAGSADARQLEQLIVAMGGKAMGRLVSDDFAGPADAPRMELLIYVPNAPGRPAPAFLGLNFGGNQSVAADPRIALARLWPKAVPGLPRSRIPADASSRGADSASWPVERIIDRGYALVTAYSGDIDPGDGPGSLEGVQALTLLDPRARPAADEWGVIAAWAWGLRRAMDYLETDTRIDPKRVAVMGHSRLGKAALWAGAQDERFAMVISHQSGEGGAALARRRFGETVAIINTAFPRWFCDNFKRYNGREDSLPVDQHELIALIAPRPVLIASAAGDRWSDPRGEFLAALGADPVYRLLGRDGLVAREMPAPGELVDSTIGYHIRPGGHAVTEADWTAALDFVDRRGLRTHSP